MSLRFSSVQVAFENTIVLDNINLCLEQSRIVIIGNNASGKSTFARVACGIVPIKKGEVHVYGQNIHAKKDLWRDINMTFQIPDRQILMPSVEEELMFGLKNSGFDEATMKKKKQDAIDILGVSPSQPCHSLSEGKKRMLCLLSITILEPRTIILDEPLTFLDYFARTFFMNYVKTLKQQVIIITQNLEEAQKFSRVICFYNGAIVEDGNGKTVASQYKQLCKNTIPNFI